MQLESELIIDSISYLFCRSISIGTIELKWFLDEILTAQLIVKKQNLLKIFFTKYS